MDTADSELIRAFAQQRSADAFAPLVHRHIDLVYSAARRQLRSQQLAEEATHLGFTALAQNAGKLDPATSVPAWLLAATRRITAELAGREGRRPGREQKPFEARATNASAEWARLAAVLDETLIALDPADTTALLLRYFETNDLRAVGRALGTTEIAAQKRVSHALDQLGRALRRRGVELSSADLAANLSAYGVEIAPAALTQTVAAGAGVSEAAEVVAAATAPTGPAGWQRVLIACAIVLSVGGLSFEAITLARAHAAVVALRNENAALLAQVRTAEAQRRDAAIAAEAAATAPAISAATPSSTAPGTASPKP